MTISTLHISPKAITMILLPVGLSIIGYLVLYGSISSLIYTCLSPIFLALLIIGFRKPAHAFIMLFTFNYFFNAWYRYSGTEGLSVWSDIVWVSLFIIIIVNTALYKNISWKHAINFLVVSGLFWGIYTVCEILNPTAVTEAWINSRGSIYNIFLISLITTLLVTRYQLIKKLLFLLSVFTLISILKALYQKYVGFDSVEMQWLVDSETYRTHLLWNITRYFSIFTDAGNFGSNMGFSFVVFGISAIYAQRKRYKIYYGVVSLLALYAMFMSGTRGAIYVPIGGILLFTLINKNMKLMFLSAIFGLCAYLFFAHTYIGESNVMISRMRSSFRPTQDASFNVRLENQKRLAEYLKHRPFGEGLGLGGVESRKYGYRVTSEIAHDSTYVKVWMETGIVGLLFYLCIYVGCLLWGCYNIMFRVKNNEVRVLLIPIACGIFGMMISAYGNAFFNQFPTGIMILTFMTILLNGAHIDKNCSIEKANTSLINEQIKK